MIKYNITGSERYLSTSAISQLNGGEIVVVSYWWERLGEEYNSAIIHFEQDLSGMGYSPLIIRTDSGIDYVHAIYVSQAITSLSENVWRWNSDCPYAGTGKHHFCLVFTMGTAGTATSCTLYVDGVEKSWDSESTSNGTPETDAYGSAYFIRSADTDNGYIGEYAIWRGLASEFTLAEVNALYNSGIIIRGAPYKVRPDGLTHYWPAAMQRDNQQINTSGNEHIDIVGGLHGNAAAKNSDLIWSAYEVIDPHGYSIILPTAPPSVREEFSFFVLG